MLKIIAGKHKGRTLKVPTNARPTLGRTRQVIFDMLISRNLIENAKVIDLFAGSGAFGLEALSRGASFVTFIEENKNACEIIKQNIKKLKEENNTKIIMTDIVYELLKCNIATVEADLIFIDPPYGKNYIQKVLEYINKTYCSNELVCAIEVEEKCDFNIPLKWSVLVKKNVGPANVFIISRN